MTAPKPIRKKDVQTRLSDWRDRLQALYSTMKGWADESGVETVAREFDVPQWQEFPMQQAGIKAGRLPALEFKRNGHHLAFRPSALWVYGANGRLNVDAGEHQYMLVDMEDRPGRPSKWRLAYYRNSLDLIPFNKGLFRKIMRESA